MRAVSLFIGSSSEARPVAEAVASVLGGAFHCAPWWTVFDLSTFTLEALEAARRKHRFAVFIGRADDIVYRRDRLENVVRDNVIGEFLMFVAGNGRDHTYLLLDRSSLPKLPSDLEGLVCATYDAKEFESAPNLAINDACQKIVRRVYEVNDRDNRRQRDAETAALSAATAKQIEELGDLAYVLRDIVDGVERDTLEAVLDETKFGDIKRAATSRIGTLCGSYEPKARAAQVLDEFVRLQDAVAKTVAALPFPKDLFGGIDEAKALYQDSVLGSIEPLGEALGRKDWPTAIEIGMGMRGKLSMEVVTEQVVRIVDDRLHRLTGHVTEKMREHYSTVALDEKLLAVSNVHRLVVLKSGDANAEQKKAGEGSHP
jgi:hypothetical protein